MSSYSKGFNTLNSPSPTPTIYKNSWDDEENNQNHYNPSIEHKSEETSLNKRIKTEKKTHLSGIATIGGVPLLPVEDKTIKLDESSTDESLSIIEVPEVMFDLSFSQKRVMDAIMARKSVFFSG